MIGEEGDVVERLRIKKSHSEDSSVQLLRIHFLQRVIDSMLGAEGASTRHNTAMLPTILTKDPQRKY